jgi:hypothetical protein
MYIKTEGSTVEVINKMECHVPKVGYGINSITGRLEKTDVIKRSNNPKEQYWERTPLPENWKKRRAAEKLLQETDPEYFDRDLERFREQEWRRRLCGVWVWIKGKAVYITGEHYVYINWWPLDDGYPKYREPDRRRYYFLQYCVEDPRSAGMIEAANRRSGKSFRGALFVYEYVSRMKDTNGGMQSKTDADAKNLFKGKLITPFRRLPDFFRPEIELGAGANPEKELKLMKPKKRGKNALDSFDDFGLNSMIDFKPSELYAYDGWKLHRYLGDEVGKTFKMDVYERHQVVKYCLRVGGKWIGKALYTTTVEHPDEKDSEGRKEIGFSRAFEQLWKDSDPDTRDANGHTKSGLYKYFTPAYEMFEFDIYGDPDIEAGKLFYMNTREGLRDNPRKLAGEISKNPFTEQELFFVSGEKCLYDAMKLNERADVLSWRDTYTERGNFVWKNGERFSEVEWIKAKNGRYEITKLFDTPEEANQVRKVDNKFIPANNFKFACACDPFKYDKVKDNRRSDCAALIGQKYDATESIYSEGIIAKYVHRAPTTAIQYEDVLKMAWYFGCQILFERNVDNWREWFKANNCEGFLMKLPGEDDYGLYSDGHGKTIQMICDYTEDYINNHIHKVFFRDLIEGWLQFRVDDTTQFDLPMAAGYLFVAMRNKKFIKKTETNDHDISNYFPRYKAS